MNVNKKREPGQNLTPVVLGYIRLTRPLRTGREPRGDILDGTEAILAGRAINRRGGVVEGLEVGRAALALGELAADAIHGRGEGFKGRCEDLQRLTIAGLGDAIGNLGLMNGENERDGSHGEVAHPIRRTPIEVALPVAAVLMVNDVERDAGMEQEARLVEERGMRVDGAGDMHSGNGGSSLRAACERWYDHAHEEHGDEAKDNEFAFHRCDSFSN